MLTILDLHPDKNQDGSTNLLFITFLVGLGADLVSAQAIPIFGSSAKN
jgi:hypothetical protein